MTSNAITELVQAIAKAENFATGNALWDQAVAHIDQAPVREALLYLSARMERYDREHFLCFGYWPNNSIEACTHLCDFYRQRSDGFSLKRQGMMQLISGQWQGAFEQEKFLSAISDYGKLKAVIKERYGDKPEVLSHQEVEGKTILIFNLSGMGDFLLFSRYIPLLEKKGASVYVLTWPAMVSFAASQTLWQARFIANQEAVTLPPEIDYWAVEEFLPGYAQVQQPSEFEQALVFNVPQHKSETSAQKGSDFQVGLLWQARNPDFSGAKRSIAVEALSVLAIEGVQLHSLQHQDQHLPQGFITHPEIKDFLSLAQVISDIDLVVSIDSGGLHLAAGLAKPVWLLSCYDHDWRWRGEETHSYLYPSVRIFRQDKNRDWESVLSRVRQALKTVRDYEQLSREQLPR